MPTTSASRLSAVRLVRKAAVICDRAPVRAATATICASGGSSARDPLAPAAGSSSRQDQIDAVEPAQAGPVISCAVAMSARIRPSSARRLRRSAGRSSPATLPVDLAARHVQRRPGRRRASPCSRASPSEISSAPGPGQERVSDPQRSRHPATSRARSRGARRVAREQIGAERRLGERIDAQELDRPVAQLRRGDVVGHDRRGEPHAALDAQPRVDRLIQPRRPADDLMGGPAGDGIGAQVEGAAGGRCSPGRWRPSPPRRA